MDNRNGGKYFWNVLVENLKGEIPPAIYPYLNNPCRSLGTLNGNALRIYVNTEFTKAMIEKEQVKDKISAVATSFFGRKTPIEIVVVKGVPFQ